MKTNQIMFAFKKTHASKWFLMICAGVFLLVACAHAYAQEVSGSSIAVMPFTKGKHPEKIEETLNCIYANICYIDEDIQSGAAEMLTLMLHEILSDTLNDKLMPMDKVGHIYDAMKPDNETDTPAIFARKLGKSLGVKYIVTGNVWRYKNRTGTAFATSTPSSVAFAVYLIDIENNELVWMKTYDETQQSLTENLLNAIDFFKQGAKWLTADEFARYGLKKILKTFPKL